MNTKAKDKKKFSSYFYNLMTYMGVSIILLVLFLECLLFGIDFFSSHSNLYVGIITHTIAPVLLLLGVIVAFWGAIRRRKKVVKEGYVQVKRSAIYIDFNNPATRNTIIFSVFGAMLIIFITAIASYKAFHYTESVEFCGLMCHKVMEPEYSTYKNSSHARVKCVECHIGEGVDWFVKSKLSGLRQVYHTVKGDYSKPIPTPIHQLRPAKETCEQCHWPDKFFDSVELRRSYFLREGAENSEWAIRMLVHVGKRPDEKAGIHTHMYIDNDIYYVAEDEKRQEISWIKSVDKKGNDVIYTSEDSAYKDKMPPQELIRKMDCMDCHNRPAHHFLPPYKMVNEAMRTGEINPSLPSIKEKAVEALSGKYETKEGAVKSIRELLTSFYEKKLGKDFSKQQNDVNQAIDQVVSMYETNFFPEMKARWDAYPDNIGHLITDGCFRCHDGQHSEPNGKVISRDCMACHTILEQGSPGNMQKNIEGLPFKHPVDIGEMWKEMNCSECHTGGS